MARILYIEDDPASRTLVKKVLENVGHEVLLAENGVLGVQTALSERIDMVLVDINLPGLDGYEVTLRLRGVPSLAKIPIIAVTAHGDRMTSLAVGCDGFIEKPIGRTFPKDLAPYLRGHRERVDDTGEQLLRETSHRLVERLEAKIGELSEANAKLEGMVQIRREFLRNLCHELATPMTPVVGYLKMLRNGELGALSGQQMAAITQVEASTTRLRSLLDTLHDVASLETGRLAFARRDFDLRMQATRALTDVKPRAADLRLEVSSLIPTRAMPTTGDPDKIRRAIAHLLDNALKFTPRGGQIAFEVQEDGGHGYLLRIADGGPGIPPDQLDRVLDPFFQLDGSETRAYGGVGMGLAFARRVAEVHSGTLRVFSPPTGPVAGKLLKGTEVSMLVGTKPSRG